MPFTEKDLHEALGQQLISFWQLQKMQEEQSQAIIAEKDKRIAELEEEIENKKSLSASLSSK